ncbi:MAG: hypothetical protein U0263_05595 [Polyangiaceae bacterium]
MGYERMLDCEITDASAVDRQLRAIEGFERYDSEYSLYFFRRVSTGKMPDLQAKIEATGIYVCDNGPGTPISEEIALRMAALGLGQRWREL